MFKIIIIFLSVILLVGCTKSNEEVNHFEKGQNYLDTFEYDEALSEFQSGIISTPSEEKNYLSAAEVYSKKGDIDKSIETLKKGFDANASISISNSLGQIYLTRGEFDESLKWFETSLLKEPSDKTAIKGKINILSLTNNNEGLKNYYDQLDLGTFDSEIYIMKAIYLLDDTKEASRLIVQSNTVDEENTDLSVELRMALTAYENAKTIHNRSEIIYILLNYGWYETAQLPITKVLNDNPFYETAYVYQGLVNLHTSQYDKAIENFLKVRELNPENIDSYIFHAQVLSMKGEEDNMIALIEELLAKEGLNLTPNQFNIIQQIYYDFGKFEKIESFYTTFSKSIEVQASAQIIYLDSLIRLEKYNQADLIIKEFNSENLTSAEKAKLKAFDAFTSYKLDRKQEGMDRIAEAENIDNTIAIIHYYKGLMMKDMGRVSEADIAFERAIELDLRGDVTKLIEEQ